MCSDIAGTRACGLMASRLALAGQVEATVDPAIAARGDAFRHAIRIEVVLKDGRVLKDSRDRARGSAANPMSREQVEAKYAQLAGKALPDARVRRVRELADGMDTREAVRVFARALTPSRAVEGHDRGGTTWS